MRTIPFRRVLDEVLGMCGQKYDSTLTDQLYTAANFINSRVLRAWNWGPWPEWVQSESRTITSGLIDKDDGTNQVIGVVWGVYKVDPKAVTSASPQTSYVWTDWGDQIAVHHSSPGTAYVLFNKPAPKFSATAWSNAVVYQNGDIVYYPATDTTGRFPQQGECYVVGQDGDGNYLWTLVEFPEVLSGYVIKAAAGDMLTYFGKRDQGQELIGMAEVELVEAARRLGIDRGRVSISVSAPP